MSIHSIPSYVHIKPRFLSDIRKVIKALAEEEYDENLERWFYRRLENFRYDSWPEGEKPGVLQVFTRTAHEVSDSRYVTEEWRELGDIFNSVYDSVFSPSHISR